MLKKEKTANIAKESTIIVRDALDDDEDNGDFDKWSFVFC